MKKSKELKVVWGAASQSERLAGHQCLPPGGTILPKEIKTHSYIGKCLLWPWLVSHLPTCVCICFPSTSRPQVLQGVSGGFWDVSELSGWTASLWTWKKGQRSRPGSNQDAKATAPALGCTAVTEGSVWRSTTDTCVTAATPPTTARSAPEVRSSLETTISASNRKVDHGSINATNASRWCSSSKLKLQDKSISLCVGFQFDARFYFSYASTAGIFAIPRGI